MASPVAGRLCGLLALPSKGGFSGIGSFAYPTLRARLSSSASCSLAVRSSRAHTVSSLSATAAQQGQEQTEQKKLVLYSKKGCCLCDGLKEKLQEVAALGRDGPLDGVHLEVRDITSNPEWERAYQYEIPVLARIKQNDIEEVLPRFSPRLGVEQISQKLAACF